MSLTDHPVFLSLTPVFLLIAVGYLAGQMRWMRTESVPDLSNLVFLVLGPALLFHTMSTVQIDELDLRPVGAYFLAVGVLFGLSVLLRGLSCRSVVLALAGTFSNLVMIGITLVKLAYGQAGLVTLLTLISVHSLVLLTAATIMLELAQAREAVTSILPTLVEAGGGGLEGARKAAESQSGDWRKLVFSLPFVGLVAFLPTIWAVVAAAVFRASWLLEMDPQMRGTVIGFVMGTIAGGIVMYVYGASMTKSSTPSNR